MDNASATGAYADKPALEQCNAYLHAHLRPGREHRPQAPRTPLPAITLAHQTGSGAHELAIRLAGALQAEGPDQDLPWTLFDRNLVEKVLEEHQLPQALAAFLPEDRRTYLQDAMTELLGVVPPSWEMVPRVAETVLHLAHAGHVVLVGRGANYITSRLPNVFHVRLIASLEQRIARIQALHHLDGAAAAAFIQKEDEARGRYVKTHFHVGATDDLQFHLVLNMDRIGCADAVELIKDAMRRCLPGG